MSDMLGGAVVAEALKFVLAQINKVKAFKPLFKNLESTMKNLLPIIVKIERMQKELDLGMEELETMTDTIERAKILVQKCSRVRWFYIRNKHKYTEEIEEINKEMVKFCQIDLQLLHHRNQLTLLGLTGNILHSVEGLGKRMDLSSVPAPAYADLCSVPKLDKVPFGFDGPLTVLKKKLLNASVRRLLVIAPPGPGKTTLVTQLCNGKEIRGHFKHIFFNVVTRTPNFRKLVHNLLQHSGQQVLATFENDPEAANVLRKRLEELTKNGPILLVLDDVWRGSESLLEYFLMDIPNLKILVTSRYDFPGFDSIYHLDPMKDDDAKAYLIECASRPDHTSQAEYDKLLQKILELCKGFPLAIKVLGGSLKNRTRTQWKGQVSNWSKGGTILDTDVLMCVKPSFDALDAHLQDCFLDLGSFLEDQKIRASILVDIWVELYDNSNMTEKEKSVKCMSNLQDLTNHNLIDLVPLGRKEPEDGFYNEFLVMQHDIIRELAIRQSKSEAVLKRINLEIRENNFPEWCLNPETPIMSASLLSISTDNSFTSSWVEMDCPNVKVLVLNISTSNYALPKFISTMKKLKVVIIINHGFSPGKLSNFSYLSSLPNLKRIRLENVSITFQDILDLQLSSLKKLALFRCSFGKVSHDTKETVDVSKGLPSLQEIDIDYCYDLVELPFWVFEVVSLKRLSITHCNKFSQLPGVIGNLRNLEILRLSSSFSLFEIPETTERLINLRFLDVSGCFQLKKFPPEIGNLQKLKKISMRDCYRCELPDSVKNLENLEVECDEGTVFLWKRFIPKMKNLTITEEETEHNLNLLR